MFQTKPGRLKLTYCMLFSSRNVQLYDTVALLSYPLCIVIMRIIASPAGKVNVVIPTTMSVGVAELLVTFRGVLAVLLLVVTVMAHLCTEHASHGNAETAVNGLRRRTSKGIASGDWIRPRIVIDHSA